MDQRIKSTINFNTNLGLDDTADRRQSWNLNPESLAPEYTSLVTKLYDSNRDPTNKSCIRVVIYKGIYMCNSESIGQSINLRSAYYVPSQFKQL